MFTKNLQRIDNEALKRRLLKVSDVDSRAGMSYCVTPSNDYILLKNDVPIDDINNPREAIKKHLNKSIKHEMGKNDVIITFGIGLGYLLDEVFNTYPSRIYVYEPDINLLHFALTNVDISEHLSSGRIYITNDLEELLSKLSSSYLSEDKLEIVYLTNYAISRNKEMLLLTQKVYDVCKSKLVDINTIARFSKQWLINEINNINYINNNQGYLLADLENKFQGQIALVAAAGPSLRDNIEKIKANRDKFVLFAVNKTVKYLLENNVEPDFVIFLDAGNSDYTLGNLKDKLANCCCITDVRADSALVNKGFKKIFYNFNGTDFLIKELAAYNKFIKFFESGGTASSLALTAAVKMGFSKVIFSGLDLAFKDNMIYSTGETMNRISQEEIIVDNIKKNLVKVKSVNGDMVYTREDYEVFIRHFEELIKKLNYFELYNTTSFGAAIPGINNVAFDDINLFATKTLQPLAFVHPVKIEIEKFVQNEFANINNIISILSKGVFSSILVSAIIKSALIYQYLQADILKVLQRNFDPNLAEDFTNKTKNAIKVVVELLQKNRMV